MFFYNMVRFILVVAVTVLGCWLIWLYNDRPAIRRTIAGISLAVLLFNKIIALGLYGIILWILQVLVTIYVIALIIAIPIFLLWVAATK